MTHFLLVVALATSGQVFCDNEVGPSVERVLCDRAMYGGYGTFSGCPGTYAGGCRPCMPARPCYGPAIQYVSASDGHHRDHKAIHHQLDEFKCSLDRLTDCLLKLEKRLDGHEKATKAGFHATDAKLKCLEDHVKAVEKKQKKTMKKVDARLKPIEERTKATDEGLKSLTKKIEDQSRDAEIKGLQDKLKRLEENEKFKGVEDKFSASDRLKALESKLLQMENVDRKRDETIIQFIDQKLDRLQGGIKRELDGIQDHLKKVDEQMRDEKDARRRLEDRLKTMPPPAPPAPPAKDSFREPPSKESLREPRESNPDTKEGRARTLPELKLAAATKNDKARIIINLPADARLYLNDQITQSKGAVRSFYTPAIEPGSKFGYTIRVEWVRNAELVTVTRQVTFQAGQQVRVNFDAPASNVQTAQIK